MAARTVRTHGHLAGLFITALLSAVAGLFLSPRLAPLIQEKFFHNPDPAANSFPYGYASLQLAYIADFIACFILFSFIRHHASLRLSLKPRHIDKPVGFAPKLARVLLVGMVFFAPLWLISMNNAHTPTGSLLGSHQAPEDVGYKTKDRNNLERIISKGARGND